MTLAEQVEQAKKELARWPKWMRDAANMLVVQGSLVESMERHGSALEAENKALKKRIAELEHTFAELLVMASCPKCGAKREDHDGLGVLMCEECGYCTHASINGDVCSLCNRRVSREEPGK